MKKKQLCSYCKNFYKCEWSKYGKPIKGWEAEDCIIKEENYQDIKSYIIKKCPKFEQDRDFEYTYDEFSKIAGINIRTAMRIVQTYIEKGAIMKKYIQYENIIKQFASYKIEREYIRKNDKKGI